MLSAPQVEPSQSCLAAVKSMRSCPACQGLPAIPPCPGYCLNIMKGCLAHHYQVDDLWARFIGEMIPASIIKIMPTLISIPHLTPTQWWANQVWRRVNSNCVYLSDSLTSLSERLVGPFNVEMTVEPISIKISDAIMNFQESGFQVADFNQLNNKCLSTLPKVHSPHQIQFSVKANINFCPYYFPVHLFIMFEFKIC